jgi:UDP-N-acetylglucosamine 4,6-dehydratase
MKTLLIFGGTGSLGHKLVERYIHIYNIVIYSRDETKHWLMRQKYKHKNIQWIIGCIRDKEAVQTTLFRVKPSIIIIASALKHIDQCEKNIDECVKTNLIGVQNIINISYKNSLNNTLHSLEKVLFISTDKACSPVNVYGMCKSICERMMVEKAHYTNTPKFINVRYGNVINSRGSLIPLFHSIGKSDSKHFPVTDKKMTRFFMSLDESVQLIHNALKNGESGDTFIPKAKSYKIIDIIQIFSELYNKPIIEIGLRPGEKLREVLINDTEVHRTISTPDNYIIKPCYNNVTSNIDLPEFDSTTNLCNIKNLIDYINLKVF